MYAQIDSRSNYSLSNPYNLIGFNLILIALMDSMVMWGIPTLGKMITYGFKFVNFLAIFYLIRNVKHKGVVWAFACIPFAWILFDQSYVLSLFQYVFSAILPLITFFLLPFEYKEKWTLLFLKLISRIFLIGFLFYILLNIGISLPYLTYTRDLDNRTYNNFFFLYYSQGLDQLTLLRFTSIWDEPGVIGTLCALVVFYYKQALSKKTYYIFVVAGFLSLSLFYILVAYPILFFANFQSYGKLKKLGRTLIFIVSLVVGYFGFSYMASKTQNHPTLKFSVYHRFEWEGGLIVGVNSNRDVMPGFENSYEKFIQKGGSTFWLTGKGKNSAVDEFGSSGLSYRILIYEKGLLIVLYLALFYIAMHKGWRKNWIYNITSITLLTLLMMQRPLLYGLYFVMIIYIGLNINKVKIND